LREKGLKRDVSVGLKADLTTRKSDFRFTPESGLRADISPCPFRANNGSGPYYSMTSSTVASRPARTVNAKRFGGLKVHDKIEVSGLRDWV